MRDRTSEANKLVMAIRDLKTQIRDRVAKAHDLDVAAAVEGLDTKLGRVEEELYQVRNRSPRDTLNYPIELNNQLAFLLDVVESGDYRPTDQTAAVFRELMQKLSELRQQFDAAVGNDRAGLHERLRARGVEAVANQ